MAPSRIVMFPLMILFLLFLYLGWTINPNYGLGALPCIMLLAAAFVMSPQIDWWWYSRNPTDIEPEATQLLENCFPFYRGLSNAEKLRYRRRVALQLQAAELMPNGMESVPAPIQIMMAANAVQVSFGQENWLYRKFENIVIYAHPFSSPMIQRLHISELFEEDGVLIFSSEQIHNSTVAPDANFPLCLYEYSRALVRSRPKGNFPPVGEEFWAAFPAIYGWNLDFLQIHTGLMLAELDPLGAAIVCFFRQPEKLKAGLPDLFQLLTNSLNLNPLNQLEPVEAPLNKPF